MRFDAFVFILVFILVFVPIFAVFIFIFLFRNVAKKIESGVPGKLQNFVESIVEFVDAVTDPKSSAYVAPERRIATFDNDGTLLIEKPMYVQLAFALDRVRAEADEHPEWKEKPPFQAVLADDAGTPGD